MVFDHLRPVEKLNKETEMYAIVEIAGQQFKVEEGKRFSSIVLKPNKTQFLNSTKFFWSMIMIRLL